MDTLPYISTFVSWEEVLKAWEKLKRYKGSFHDSYCKYKLPNLNFNPVFKIHNYETVYRVIVLKPNDYFKLNFLTDYFTEPSRLQARRFDQILSPKEYWDKNQLEIKKQNPNADTKELRSILYQSVIECSNFRLTVAISVYDIFLPSTIFDPCCGHGDRALSAMSRSYIQCYEGCEPNIESQSRIVKMIETLNVDKCIKVYPNPFEDYIFKQEYDLVFTSPPYFDVEVYCNNPNQSIMKYKTESTWYDQFLLPMFIKCWKQIKINGHLIISINNVWNKEEKRMQFSSTERLISDLNLLQDAKYLGVISFGDLNKRKEPMFVWKKK